MIIRLLSLLLVAQLAVAAYLYWPREAERAAPAALVTLAAPSLSTLRIGDGESSVTLTRQGDRWILDGGLPADPMKITAVVQALTDQVPGFAVATSAGAAQRFEVAEDSFQRRIELSGGDDSETVFLGTSPAFRKIHARNAADDAIYLVELNSYDAPTAIESWLDRSLAALTSIDRLRLADREFTLDDEDWVDSAGGAADGEAMENLVQALARLQVTGLADGEDSALAEAGEESLHLVARRDDGSEVTLVLRENDGRYFLRSSAFAPLFTVSAYDAERLIDPVRILTGSSDPAAQEDSQPEPAGSEVTTESGGAAAQS